MIKFILNIFKNKIDEPIKLNEGEPMCWYIPIVEDDYHAAFYISYGHKVFIFYQDGNVCAGNLRTIYYTDLQVKRVARPFARKLIVEIVEENEND